MTYNITYFGAITINLTPGDVVLNTTGSANGNVSVANGTTPTPTVTISGISGVGTIGISITPGTSSNASGNTDLGAGTSQVFSTNSSPYFSAIQDQIMNEDDTLKISIDALDDDGDGLIYAFLSSNSLSNSYFVENVLSVVPDTNWSGSSIVFIYVSDPYQTASWTFSVDVLPVNDVPQVSFQLSPITFNEDGEITFSLGELYPFIEDAESADSSLTITLESKSENITITEINDSTVLIGAEEDWYGFDSVTVNVFDGLLTTSASFGVNVLPVNDIPVFVNLPDKLTIEHQEGITIEVFDFVEDIETADTSLTMKIFAENDSLHYTYKKEMGELKLFAENGYKGETEINIIAIDEEGDSTEVFVLVEVSPQITGIEDLTGIPNEYEVSQNYPNPFNPSTKIRYGLPNESKVYLVIYNILGQEVVVLKNTTQGAGYHEVEWDASSLSSGVYIYRLTAESANGDKQEFVKIKKMILLK